MRGRYERRHGIARVGHVLWMSVGALLMMGLMLAGLLVLCICVGYDLCGDARPLRARRHLH